MLISTQNTLTISILIFFQTHSVFSIYCYQCDTTETSLCSDDNIHKSEMHFLRPQKCSLTSFFCMKQTRRGTTLTLRVPGDSQAYRHCSKRYYKDMCYWQGDDWICMYSCNTNYCNGSFRLGVKEALVVVCVGLMVLGIL